MYSIEDNKHLSSNQLYLYSLFYEKFLERKWASGLHSIFIIQGWCLRGCNCTHGFWGKSHCNMGFAPAVLKEITLLGNEMKLHLHFETPNLTPTLLFRFFVDVWFWVQRLSHSVIYRWDFRLPVASGGAALDVNITLLVVLVIALMSLSLRWLVWSISPLLLGNDNFYLMLLSVAYHSCWLTTLALLSISIT